MAQWIRALTDETDHLSSAPGIYSGRRKSIPEG